MDTSSPKDNEQQASLDEMYDSVFGKSSADYYNLPEEKMEKKLDTPEKELLLSLLAAFHRQTSELCDRIDMFYSVFRVCHKMFENKIPNLQHTCFRETTKTNGSVCGETENKPVHDDLPSLQTRPLKDPLDWETLFDLIDFSRGARSITSKTRSDALSPSLKFIVKELSEVGMLYGTIVSFVKTEYQANNGSVVQALLLVLQKEMDSYHAYINSWLHTNCKALNQKSPVDFLSKSAPLDRSVESRLRYLTKVVQIARGLTGCSLISAVARSDSCEAKNSILKEITKPIHSTMVRWMAAGVLEDEHCEFFIADNAALDDWSADSVVLSESNKLVFAKKSRLQDVYRTGRNMRFLLNVCSSLRLQAKIAVIGDYIQQSLSGQEGGLIASLIDGPSSLVVAEACVCTSDLLLETLADEYDLFVHFEGLRNYMLFGRGDFYAYVVYKLETFFGRHTMHRYQLKGIMEDAYESTSAGNDDRKVFDSLRYRIDLTETTVDWGSLKFEYAIGEPLNRIFSPHAKVYTNVFQFLWCMKKVDWTMNKFWHDLSHFVKKKHMVTEPKQILRNFNALLSNMINCMHEIQNFMFEMINNEWELFWSKISGAKSIDIVIKEHRVFLGSLAVFVHDASLKGYIDSFQLNVQKLEAVFYQLLAIRQTHQTTDASKSQYDLIIEQFKRVQKTHELELGAFLVKLMNNESQGLGTLAMRIDFNGYYMSNANCLYRAAPCVVVD
ncbi:gamma-tubulin complex component 3 homolog [Adelges cooleyi]|uniref:gamma-tubulin complex component 3 homolog n=1 Tax=Adelges cooleyi TaxID=133065 RepID=UPI00217F2715|nr:gamma-tubulin complex component 3 homolog [Adelges cooleyi]